MSFLFDSTGPFDVGAYFLLARSANAFSTSFLSVAIARAVGAWPFSGGSKVWTSHRGPSTSSGMGRDGAVFGVEVPQTVDTANRAASWCGVRFLPGPSSLLVCSHHDVPQLGRASDGWLGYQLVGPNCDTAGVGVILVGSSLPVNRSLQPGFTGASSRELALASSRSSALVRFILSHNACGPS